MRLKHFLYFVTIACAVSEIGMALYAMYWGDILHEVVWANQTHPDSEQIVVRALNVALPAGVACIGLLLWTWKVDCIGGFALFMAAALHLIGFDLNFRAMKKIYGSEATLASVTWWAPEDSSRPNDSGETGEDVPDGRSS